MNKLKCLSLFNGISGLHLSLDKANIPVDVVYYAEIDKWANKVTEHHYPNDVALGDVTKWREWDIDWSSIDLVTAGFPCQSWSLAGKGLGDQDERGMLFWVTLDIIKQVITENHNAKFVMENVKMKKDFEQYITHHTTQALGNVEKILLNSGNVSAQTRSRNYWSNFTISMLPQGVDKTLQDILEYPPNPKYILSEARQARYVSYIRPRGNRVGTTKLRVDAIGQRDEVFSTQGKMWALTATMGKQPNQYITKEGVLRKLSPLECERLQTMPDNFTSMLSDSQRYKSIGNGWTIDVIAHILKDAFKTP